MRSIKLLVLLALTGFAGGAWATVIGFDFESQAVASHTAPHDVTAAGLTVTIGQGDPTATDFRFADGGGGVPAGFGGRSLESLNGASFVFEFSTAVDGVSIDFADAAADADTGYLYVFGPGGGAALGFAGDTLVADPAGGPTWATLSVQAAGITSAMVMATPDNSVWWDNLQVTRAHQVPEPLTPALLVAGLGLLGLQRRAARRRTA
ncbi:MAG: PEP-CTERM sorting domain-containing protein [Gammaproteobacteria bacterium]|nr:PEP-CTERM sorting domain-containing protein [Gammaproteobacteria bacterium]